MKFLKIFSVLALSALTINMSAETNVMAQLVFASDEANTNYLISQDDAVDNNFTSESCGKITLSPDAYALYAYTEYNSEKYAAVDLKNISNIVVKFQPNAYEVIYTLTVSDVEGDFMLVLGNDTITESKNNPFMFIADTIVEFIVNPAAPVYPRTVAAGQWATICYDKQITAVEGATMYEFVKYDEAAKQVAADPVDVDALVAGKAYLFMATADAQAFTYTGEVVAEAQENNGLFGTFVEMQLEEDAWGIKKGTSLIYPAKAGSTVPAYCAYIDLNEIEDKTHAPARAGRKIFNVATTPTGMMLVGAEAAQDGKRIENGRLVIIKAGQKFNAQGQQL